MALHTASTMSTSDVLLITGKENSCIHRGTDFPPIAFAILRLLCLQNLYSHHTCLSVKTVYVTQWCVFLSFTLI